MSLNDLSSMQHKEKYPPGFYLLFGIWSEIARRGQIFFRAGHISDVSFNLCLPLPRKGGGVIHHGKENKIIFLVIHHFSNLISVEANVKNNIFSI